MTVHSDYSENDSDGSETSENLQVVRRGKFDDEEDDGEVLDSWEAADDPTAEHNETQKTVKTQPGRDARALSSHKAKARIVQDSVKQKSQAVTNEADDPIAAKMLSRQKEKEADLRHAEDLIGGSSTSSFRRDAPLIVPIGHGDDSTTINLLHLPVFNPSSREEFSNLRDVLLPILEANASKAHYNIFLQDLIRSISKELSSDTIKKISSTLTTLSNEKLKEEKAADKGGKKAKSATTKAKLVAHRDMSMKADTTSYDHDLGDDDFM